MTRRRSRVVQARRAAHRVEVLLGHVRAVQTGRVGRRVVNYAAGRALGRALRRWWL